jgi:hypothetical protein
MEPLELGDLPEDALILIDSAPVIYFLEGHSKFGPRFKPLFEAHATGHLRWRTPFKRASALAINAAALVTHGSDFSRVRSLRVIC